ncbi:Cloroperoxidase [Neolentinus lepideus HHB14362 ss-1]|uniref:Cloroperoxidase n=1 Tax=Neolentinus lepideus HHB14362 ss-1 TaxID=1314782 RepID=A0A165SDZ3_9AGAM|nr:Cloroperoxidase [Neolentinus lepideus HHB14362 ss-1]
MPWLSALLPSPTTDHEWQPARPEDKRSPCPALNTLANYGYISRNGRNIKFWYMIHALQAVYNLSLPLALFLAIPGYLLCGSILRMSLNLDDLALHNRLEHDASLVHDDAPAGSARAPTNVDPALLHSFLHACPVGHGFRLEDYAKIRVVREATLPPGKSLDAFHAEVSRGEAALSWLLMQDGKGEVSPERMNQWYGEEKLPEDWKKPERPLGLLTTRFTAAKVKNLMASTKHTAAEDMLPIKR